MGCACAGATAEKFRYKTFFDIVVAERDVLRFTLPDEVKDSG